MFLICLKPHYQVYTILKTCPLNIAKFKTDEDVNSMKSIFKVFLNMFLICLKKVSNVVYCVCLLSICGRGNSYILWK